MKIQLGKVTIEVEDGTPILFPELPGRPMITYRRSTTAPRRDELIIDAGSPLAQPRWRVVNERGERTVIARWVEDL
jgi:hypothetical protein